MKYITDVPGIEYHMDKKRYILDPNYIKGKYNINLSVRFGNDTNAKEILDRISRQVFNYIYDEKTYPEDIKKKEYLIITNRDVVIVIRDIMISHLEAVVMTRRDMLALQHGIDFDGAKVIEDFEKNMEHYQFALDTRRIFNRHRLLKYKERLNLRDIDGSLIGSGY